MIMSYYQKKENLEGKTIADRPLKADKDINGTYRGTSGGPEPVPPGEGVEKKPADPTEYKDYDAAENSGGSHSSTEKPEN
jgi:hypothetical protein